MIIYWDRISESDVLLNPWLYFVFGDNDARMGYGGQAAVLRGKPNTVGIRTKKFPGTNPEHYYTDQEYKMNVRKIEEDLGKIKALLKDNRLVVMPQGGIGTGRAQLRSRAPETFRYLNNELNALYKKYGDPTTNTGRVVYSANSDELLILPRNPSQSFLEKASSYLNTKYSIRKGLAPSLVKGFWEYLSNLGEDNKKCSCRKCRNNHPEGCIKEGYDG